MDLCPEGFYMLHYIYEESKEFMKPYPNDNI